MRTSTLSDSERLLVSLPIRYVCIVGCCNSITLPTNSDKRIPNKRAKTTNIFFAVLRFLGALLLCKALSAIAALLFSPVWGVLSWVICVLFCSCTNGYIQKSAQRYYFFLTYASKKAESFTFSVISLRISYSIDIFLSIRIVRIWVCGIGMCSDHAIVTNGVPSE